MRENIELINVKPEHLPEIYALVCALEKQELNLGAFEEVFLENLEKPSIFYLAASREGKLVGFVSLHVQRLLHHCGCIGEVQELVVQEGLQGEGIGAMLLGRAKDIAREMGCSDLEVACGKKRERSHAFYEKQGMGNTHYKFTFAL